MSAFGKAASGYLIKYVSKIEMVGCIRDPNSKSIFEFARQVGTPHLKKSNPKLNWDFKHSTEPSCSVTVEFMDGTKWEVEDPAAWGAIDMRDEMFYKAKEVEYNYEVNGDNPIVGEDEDVLERGKKK